MRNADGLEIEKLYLCSCGAILTENSMGIVILETVTNFCPYCGSQNLQEVKE